MSHKILPKKWVLIRGLIRSREHWGDFPEKLKVRLNLESAQCVELPGNGYLNTEITPTKIDDVISSFKKQISGVNEPIGIIGISLGGMLAAKWAQAFPGEVSHLILINSSSPLNSFHERLLIKNYPGIFKTLFFSDPVQIEEFILGVSSNEVSKWNPLLHSYSNFQAAHPVSTMNFIRQLRLTSQVDFKVVPQAESLILTSTKDRLVHHKCSEQIAQTWNCPIHFHNRAGHDLPLDDAEWVLDQIVFSLNRSAVSAAEVTSN